MILQQKVEAAIEDLSDEKLNVLLQFVDFIEKNEQVSVERPGTSVFYVKVADKSFDKKRHNKIKFGVGKNIINNVDEFDIYNDEITDFLLGEDV